MDTVKFLSQEVADKYADMSWEEIYADCVVMVFTNEKDEERKVYSQRKLRAKTKKLTGQSYTPYAFRYVTD